MIQALDPRDPETAGDIHRVSQLAYAVEARLLGVESFPPLAETIENIQESKDRFFGAIDDGQLIGVVSVEDQADGLLIARLVVAPTFLRRGVATELVQYVINSAKCNLYVSTATENKPALALYRKLGFEPNSSELAKEGISLVTLVFGT